MTKKILFITLLLTTLVPKIFAYDICYIGRQDNLYNEIIKRGHTIKEYGVDCDIIVVNTSESIRLEATLIKGIEKIIFVNMPPKTSCAYRVTHTLKKLSRGKLIITKYNIKEEFDEFEANIFQKPIMKPLGVYLIFKENIPVNVAFMQRHHELEYYAFDITKSEKLMDALFSETKESRYNPIIKPIERETGKRDKDDYNFKQKIMLAMLFGLLLNIPLCIIVFASGALEESNRNIVYNFMIGRALGLLAIGIIFIKIVSYFQEYNHLFTLGFGVICLGIAYGTYKKKQFCKNAFSYTGGFLKGITPCAKLTPVFPLLIGASLSDGIIIMLTFIMASTIYFLLLFYFGTRLLKKLNKKINKRYTSLLFLILGIYFILRGLKFV